MSRLALVILLVCACGDDSAPAGGGGDGGAGGDGGGGGGGQCLAPGDACDPGAPEACCSARCEPVTGMTGVTRCTGFCAGEGAACARALDCCDLSCNDGVCGGERCKVQSEPCTTNAECCSNLCDGQECRLDPANTECRGTGETCTSGSQQGCCSMVCDEEADPPRCDFGAETCAAQGAACETPADCCRGTCAEGVCVTPCAPDESACAADADCCSGACGGDGLCAPPAGCEPIGELCATAADCCSGLCFGGRCDQVVVD